jgi:hypothetical protein
MDHPLPVWLRAFFLLVTVQALVVAAGIVQPTLIPRLLPWDASPLNARFIAALYAMGALSALLCLLAPRYAETRITLIEIGLVTLLLLLITIPRLGEFAPPRSFPLGWVLSYLVDPLLAAILLWRMRGRGERRAGPNRHMAVLMAYAIVLGVLGAILLTLPAVAAQIWPWELPDVLSQIYSTFFLGMGACAALAARDPRPDAVRIFAIGQLFLLVLVLIVSLVHANSFRAGISTWLWFAGCLVGSAAFVFVLVRRPGRSALSRSLS